MTHDCRGMIKSTKRPETWVLEPNTKVGSVFVGKVMGAIELVATTRAKAGFVWVCKALAAIELVATTWSGNGPLSCAVAAPETRRPAANSAKRLRTPLANGTMVWSKNFSNGSEHNIKFPFVQSVSTENSIRQWLDFCHKVYPYSPFDNSDGKAGIPKSACRKIPGDAVGSQPLPAAGLVAVGCFGPAVTAHHGDAPPSPPCPQPKSLAAAPLAIFRQAPRSSRICLGSRYDYFNRL